jgi:hypothetical protein
MELFPAADDDAWTLIQRVIDSSDYYLLVVGGKYGSIDPETELSFTEKEYDYAVSRGKPALAFLHGKPDEIPLGKSEKADKAREKLELFRRKVETQKHVKYWTTPDDLAGKVALSFASFRQTYPAVGWVRGDVQTSAEALSELHELRKRLEEKERQLVSARTAPPPGTEGLAQGADVVGFSPLSRVKVETLDPYRIRSVDTSLDVEITWDELFSAAGPALLDEVDQDSLYNSINTWLTRQFGARARREARRSVTSEGYEFAKYKSTIITLSRDDFGTLIVQWRALGLISRSGRKRSVSDKGTYWTLTPYGDAHLTTLRAISRFPREGSSGGEEEE